MELELEQRLEGVRERAILRLEKELCRWSTQQEQRT